METARALLVLTTSCGLLLLVSHDLRQGGTQAWRRALLEASVVLGVLVWLVSEALGAFHAITPAGVLISWTLVGLIAVIIAARPSRGSAFKRILGELNELAQGIRSLPRGSLAVLAFMALSASILAAIALVAAPNTWDSMTYHLSRVMHWQQDHGLAFYATSVQRQLSFSPLAEMTVLQYQVLAGSDRLANFPQWFGMMGCVIGASLIAKRLGGNSNAQFFAALATITLPMGVLQATSTQNDYLMALWCVCFAEFVLECRSDVFRPRSVLMAGAALGLAILAKVTAVLYLAPFGLWLAVELWRRLSLKAWKPLIGVVIVAGVILAPHSLRNRGLFGTPLGPTAGQELGGLTNEAHSLPILVSNIIRNLGLQLALPVEGFNSGLESLLQKTHAVLGTDMSDPRTTWRGLQFHLVFSNYEDSAGNPLHLVLLVAAVVLVFRSRNAQSAVYLLCLAVGFVAFCWLLKWQPWNSRLNLTLFVLGMPLAAAVWTEQLPRRALSLSSLVLALGAIPYLIANPTRPLLGANSIFLKDRLHQYFTNVPDSLASYEAAARMIHDAACSSVGLASPPEGREYLLWVTNAVYGDRIRIEHVLVKNVSRRLTTDFLPCAIVFTYPVQEPDISYRDMAYTRFISTERFSLFLAATAAP